MNGCGTVTPKKWNRNWLEMINHDLKMFCIFCYFLRGYYIYNNIYIYVLMSHQTISCVRRWPGAKQCDSLSISPIIGGFTWFFTLLILMGFTWFYWVLSPNNFLHLQLLLAQSRWWSYPKLWWLKTRCARRWKSATSAQRPPANRVFLCWGPVNLLVNS